MNIQELPQGLQELVEAIDFIFLTVDAVKAAKEDGGGINLGDWNKVLKVVDSADTAYEGVELIPNAWVNATEEEKNVVWLYFSNKFDIANDVIEVKIEKAVKAAYLLGDLFVN